MNRAPKQHNTTLKTVQYLDITAVSDHKHTNKFNAVNK